MPGPLRFLLAAIGAICHHGTALDEDALASAVSSGGSATIEFDRDIYLTDTISMDSIPSPVNIDGHGFELDGQNNVRCLYIKNTIEVAIRGLSVVNGYFGTGNDYGGGGIHITTNSVVRMSSCEIINNAADGGYGGGVYLEENSLLYISDSILIGNTATYGGFLYSYGSSAVFITRSIINNNRATKDGGGINAEMNVHLNVSYSDIANNTALRYGGGLYIEDYSNASIVGCDLNYNSASKDGGGIYVYRSAVSIVKCDIDANKAGKQGGGMCTFNEYNQDHLRVNVLDSRIVNNVAAQSGGGAYIDYNSYADIKNCTIADNWSGNEPSPPLTDSYEFDYIGGGGLFVNYYSELRLKMSIVSNNSATAVSCSSSDRCRPAGSGILIKRANVILDACEVTENSAYRGGGIYAITSFFQITDTHIDENKAQHKGGGVYSDYTEVEMASSRCTKNTAGTAGGGVNFFTVRIFQYWP